MTQSHDYKRILLKLSGEVLSGTQPFGIDQNACRSLAAALKALIEEGKQVAVVIGGGNIFRGIQLNALGVERTPADHMGMLATIMNGIALKQAMTAIGCPSHVMSALDCPKVAESYNWSRALEILESGSVLIFVGGTGNPYFTTDTAAAMRANEIQADALFKATKVDGIYDKDPLKFPDAVKYDTMTYEDVLSKNLKVMDATAVALCRSNGLPIFVFNMEYLVKQQLTTILTQSGFGTLVSEKK